MGHAFVLVIDNHDSFTFNLVQALGMLGARVEVVTSDRIELGALVARRPTHVVISPGPGRPEEAGASLPIARAALEGGLGEARLLGVCLGHQCLGLAAGARVIAAQRLVHGRASTIAHDGVGIFAGLPAALSVGRYHSLAVEEASLPRSLVVSARAADGEVMALRHESGRLDGVQFHPESILMPEGPALLARFVNGGAR